MNGTVYIEKDGKTVQIAIAATSQSCDLKKMIYMLGFNLYISLFIWFIDIKVFNMLCCSIYFFVSVCSNTANNLITGLFCPCVQIVDDVLGYVSK